MNSSPCLESRPLELIAPGIMMEVLCRFDGVSVDHILVEEGSIEHEVVHHKTDEFIYVLEGRLEALIDGRASTLCAGSCVLLKRGTRHKFTCSGAGRTRLLAICSPPYSKDDVEVVSHG